MAFFRSSPGRLTRKEALRRVQAHEWSDKEGMSRALQDLAAFPDLKPADLLPLLPSPDPTLRRFAELQIAERLTEGDVRAILGGLSLRPPRFQALILHAFVRANADLCIPHIQKLVLGGDPKLSMVAMEALSSLPGAQIGEDFLPLLKHEKADVRLMALAKLRDAPGLLQDGTICQNMLELASDEDERLRAAVLELLPNVQAQDAIRVCLSRLKDPATVVQQRAVRLLGTSLARLEGVQAPEDELIELLRDGDDAVRTGVLNILLGRPDRVAVLRKLLLFTSTLSGWMRERIMSQLREHADQLLGPLLGLMGDPDEDIRALSVGLGATLESEQAVPHIIPLLTDPDWWIRMVSAETLGKIADPRAVPALIEALDDPETAMACLEALANIGDAQALEPIVRQLSSPEVEIRIEAIDALRRILDPRVVPALQECFRRDSSLAVRSRALEAARELGGMGGGGGRFHIPEEHRPATIDDLSSLEILLVEAKERGASDLHVMVGVPPTFRIHGRLRRVDMPPWTAEIADRMLRSILRPRDAAALAEQQHVDFCHNVPNVGRFRCNVFVESRGLAGSFRVIPEELPTLETIGLPEHLSDLVDWHQGLMVVAGPSGSGKSTTLAALVNLLNERKRKHILLLEDPVEYVHPVKGCLITQREMGRHSLSFAASLRGALRQDPDVIVVGQMRDPETVKLAIEASETGHLVIGTMNTTSAPETPDRIIESFPASEQAQVRTMVAETLKTVVCQQLIPRADGQGRIACFEVMMGSRGIATMIRDAKSFQIVGQMQIGERLGHITRDVALERLVNSGLITAEAAWLRARNKDRFSHRLSADELGAFLTGGDA